MRDDQGSQMPHAIRGAAALVVAAAHMWQVFLYPLDKETGVFNVLGGLACWSVATFFALSGILIAWSIKRRSEDGGFDFYDFMAARVLRIYPPLVASVLVTIGVVLIIQGFELYGSENYLWPGDEAFAREKAELEWSAVWTTLALTYNLVPGHRFLSFNGPLWSLSYEFWLYVLAGLSCAAWLNRAWYAAIGAVVLIVMMFVVAHPTPPFWSVSAVWWAGFAVGWFWPAIERIQRRFIVLLRVGLIVTAVAVAGADLQEFLIGGYVGTRQNTFYVLFSGAILCVVALMMMSDVTPWQWLIKTGAFSYTLYLIHFPLLMLMLSLFRPLIAPFGPAGHVVLAIGALVAVVSVSHRLGKVVENRAALRLLFARLTAQRA